MSASAWGQSSLVVASAILAVVSFGCRETCSDLEDIRMMPFPGEPGPWDPVYERLMGASEAAVPCLIDRITDDTLMTDPRKAPPYGGFTVGDAAVVMVARVTGVPFESVLPPEVLARWSDQGVYAYFEFVESAEGRRAIQQAWRARWAEMLSRASEPVPPPRELLRIRSPAGWCEAQVIEWDNDDGSGNTQVLLDFDNGCSSGAVTFDASNLGLRLNWLDDRTLEVAHPKDAKSTRNALGDVHQCLWRKVRVVLTPS